MPTDEHDERAAQPTPGDSGGATPEAPPPGGGVAPRPRRRGLRRVINRRNAMWTGIVAVVAVVALALIIFVLYRSGQVDNYVARQIVSTLAKYNIRAEIGSFSTRLGPREVEINDLKLYNSATGAQIGHVGRILATVRVEDMWALSLSRNVNLEKLVVDRPEIWVVYDAEGRSNFSGLTIPPPQPNQRILFAYSTAEVSVNDAIVHYDDRRYDISGEAKNVRATVLPDDPNAPAESRMNRIDLTASDSTFTLNGRTVNPIGVELHARVNQTRADVSELVLRSPVAEARLSGALDDWRALRYHMDVRADVDLTQTSDLLRLDTTLRGAGRFEGKVTGEGDRYKVEGQIASDALAADGVRLKALSVNATASGQGSSYEAQGKAVAELLTAGDYQLNLVQLVGGVTGTGSDFRWLGDLRAAAARSGSTSSGRPLRQGRGGRAARRGGCGRERLVRLRRFGRLRGRARRGRAGLGREGRARRGRAPARHGRLGACRGHQRERRERGRRAGRGRGRDHQSGQLRQRHGGARERRGAERGRRADGEHQRRGRAPLGLAGRARRGHFE